MNTGKYFLKSKTILANSILLVLGALPQVMPEIRAMSVHWYVALTLASPVLNMWLRSITKEPIRLKK